MQIGNYILYHHDAEPLEIFGLVMYHSFIKTCLMGTHLVKAWTKAGCSNQSSASSTHITKNLVGLDPKLGRRTIFSGSRDFLISLNWHHIHSMKMSKAKICNVCKIYRYFLDITTFYLSRVVKYVPVKWS